MIVFDQQLVAKLPPGTDPDRITLSSFAGLVSCIATQALDQLTINPANINEIIVNGEDCQSSSLEPSKLNTSSSLRSEHDINDERIDQINSSNDQKDLSDKIAECPVCGTPCRLVGAPDFLGSSEGCTLHYEPLSNFTQEDE